MGFFHPPHGQDYGTYTPMVRGAPSSVMLSAMDRSGRQATHGGAGKNFQVGGKVPRLKNLNKGKAPPNQRVPQERAPTSSPGFNEDSRDG